MNEKIHKKEKSNYEFIFCDASSWIIFVGGIISSWLIYKKLVNFYFNKIISTWKYWFNRFFNSSF